jgi:hypothetical protein
LTPVRYKRINRNHGQEDYGDFITGNRTDGAAMTVPYLSFLLRLLRSGRAANAPWQISLQDTRSLETREFSDLEALQRYLTARLAGEVSAAPGERPAPPPDDPDPQGKPLR